MPNLNARVEVSGSLTFQPRPHGVAVFDRTLGAMSYITTIPTNRVAEVMAALGRAGVTAHGLSQEAAA